MKNVKEVQHLLAVEEAHQSRDGAVHDLSFRTTSQPPSEQEAETDDDDIRRATLSLGSAFTVLMSSWPGFKDMGIRVSAVKTL